LIRELAGLAETRQFRVRPSEWVVEKLVEAIRRTAAGNKSTERIGRDCMSTVVGQECGRLKCQRHTATTSMSHKLKVTGAPIIVAAHKVIKCETDDPTFTLRELMIDLGDKKPFVAKDGEFPR
jgi:hypothetical protein